MLVPETLWQIYSSHRENYFADAKTRALGVDLELSGRRKDGIEFPVNVSVSHIDTGDVLLVITAVGDVTKQKRAVHEAALTAAIVQYSDDAIIGCNLAGTITSWNPAAEKMFGYSAQEMIGRSDKELTPKDRIGEVKAAVVRSTPPRS